MFLWSTNTSVNVFTKYLLLRTEACCIVVNTVNNIGHISNSFRNYENTWKFQCLALLISIWKKFLCHTEHRINQIEMSPVHLCTGHKVRSAWKVFVTAIGTQAKGFAPCCAVRYSGLSTSICKSECNNRQQSSRVVKLVS